MLSHQNHTPHLPRFFSCAYKLCFRQKKKVVLPEQKNEGIPEDLAAKRAWEMEMTIDRSFIRETFYGQWRSVLRKLI